MKLIETVRLIESVLIYYPHASIEASQQTVDAWHLILNDCEAEKVHDRLIAHVKSGNRFAPTPGELYIKSDPYDPLYDYGLSKKRLAEIEEMNRAAERMTPKQKENVVHAKRDIERLLNANKPTDV